MALSNAEETFVLDTRRYFSNIAVWPRQPVDVNPRGWLSNFDRADRELATNLLDSFLLISTEQSTKMVSSAFHALAASQHDMFELSSSEYQSAWTDFRSRILVTYPARPNDPAGSGHIYARAARSLVAAPDQQLFDPPALVQRLTSTATAATVVFVDDFSGTGDQFCDAWARDHSTADGSVTSFAALSDEGRIAEAIFLPAIVTASAKAHIARFCPAVDVRPAHVLPPRYSASDPDTTLVPAPLRAGLDDLLVRYADRAGYSAAGRYGYGDCGLAISFEHATPDNTLPIFNGGPMRPSAWTPLRSM